MQRSHTIGLRPDTLMSGERRRQLAEEILLKSEAGEGTLFAIDGSTVDGVTSLGATYAIDTAEGRREVNRELAVPFAQGKRLPFPDPPTRFHLAYGYAKRVRLTEEPGAQYLGRFEFMVDGRLAYCDRWRVPVPGFGNVIIWRGAPYPS